MNVKIGNICCKFLVLCLCSVDLKILEAPVMVSSPNYVQRIQNTTF
jgi:hypothetical protein